MLYLTLINQLIHRLLFALRFWKAQDKMKDEYFYRILAVCIITVAISVSMYFRHQADQEGGRIARENDGTFFLMAIRLLAFFGMGSFLAYLLNPGWVPWCRFPLPIEARIGGGALAATSVILIFWLFKHLGKNVSPTATVRVNSTLVTSGPYRWIRHPLYTAGYILWSGIAVLTTNWCLLVVLLIFIPILRQRTTIEETNLLEVFGDDYVRYMKQTGRFFPRLKKPAK